MDVALFTAPSITLSRLFCIRQMRVIRRFRHWLKVRRMVARLDAAR